MVLDSYAFSLLRCVSSTLASMMLAKLPCLNPNGCFCGQFLRLRWVIKAPCIIHIDQNIRANFLEAVIIGCSPAFAGIIRRYIDTRNASYSTPGYIQQPVDSEDVRLKSLITTRVLPGRRRSSTSWQDGNSSQEAFARSGDQIAIINRVHRAETQGGPEPRLYHAE